MRTMLTRLIVFLLFLPAATFSDNRGTPWDVSWPFFQNAQAPHSIIGGYGDWCTIVEGAHPGLDFGAIPGDSVLAPSDMTLYTRKWFSGPLGYTLIFGIDSISQEGWGVTHLKITDPYIWPFTDTSVVMNHQPLAPCFQYGTTPLHMHLQWVDNLSPIIQPGLRVEVGGVVEMQNISVVH